jgi:hypothetical protein
MALELYRMLSSVRNYLRNYHYGAWVLEGSEIKSHKTMRVFYLGANVLNKNYIANLIFGGSVQENFIGRFWLLNPLRFSHKRACTCDMAITEVDRKYKSKSPHPNYFIPCWVDGKIEIEEALRLAECQRHTRNDLKRVRKHGYSYEIRHDVEKYIEFYEKFYVPYIKNTYTDEATMHSLDCILGLIDRSELLMVKDGNKDVVGEVLVYRDNEPKVLCLGVRNGDRGYVKAGAINAAYYFRLVHLKSQGHKTIDLGSSRAFFDDGVLQYKRKWGLSLTGTRSTGFMIHPDISSPAAAAFLLNHQFLCNDQDGFTSVCFVDDNTVLEEKKQKQMINKLVLPGVKKLQVFQLGTTVEPMKFCVKAPCSIKVNCLSI